MKIVRNDIIPFEGFLAINLFGILFVRGNGHISQKVVNHESIHTAQMKELLYIFFYLWYILEWLIRLLICWNGKAAYRKISFEQEAYDNEGDMRYLENRKHFAWFKYVYK